MAAQIGSYNNDALSVFDQFDDLSYQDPRFLACSEPLVRHMSSDQSSFTSSTPASPLLSTSFNSSFYTMQASTPGSPMFSQLQDMPGTSTSVGSPFSSTSCEGQSPMNFEEFPGESYVVSTTSPALTFPLSSLLFFSPCPSSFVLNMLLFNVIKQAPNTLLTRTPAPQ